VVDLFASFILFYFVCKFSLHVGEVSLMVFIVRHCGR
jgi:hypothetical protein